MARYSLSHFAHLGFVTYACAYYLLIDLNIEEGIKRINNAKRNVNDYIEHEKSGSGFVRQNIGILQDKEFKNAINTFGVSTNLNNLDNKDIKEDLNSNLNEIQMDNDRNNVTTYKNILHYIKGLYGLKESVNNNTVDEFAVKAIEQATKAKMTNGSENYFNVFNKVIDESFLQNNLLNNQDNIVKMASLLNKTIDFIDNQSNIHRNIINVKSRFHVKNGTTIPNNYFTDNKNINAKDENTNFIKTDKFDFRTPPPNFDIINSQELHNNSTVKQYLLNSIKLYEALNSKLYKTLNSKLFSRDLPIKFPLNLIRFAAPKNQTEGADWFSVMSSSEINDLKKIYSLSNQTKDDSLSIYIRQALGEEPERRKENYKLNTTETSIGSSSMNTSQTTATTPRNESNSMENFENHAYQNTTITASTLNPVSKFYTSMAIRGETYIVAFGIRMICHLKDIESWEKLRDVAIIFAYEYSVVVEENQDVMKYLGTPIDLAFKDFARLIRKWNEREARGNLSRYCSELKNRQRQKSWYTLNHLLDHFELFMDKIAVHFIVEVWEKFKKFPSDDVDFSSLSNITRMMFDEVFINPFKRVLAREKTDIMHMTRRLSWFLNAYAKRVKYPNVKIKLRLTDYTSRVTSAVIPFHKMQTNP